MSFLDVIVHGFRSALGYSNYSEDDTTKGVTKRSGRHAEARDRIDEFGGCGCDDDDDVNKDATSAIIRGNNWWIEKVEKQVYRTSFAD